jgi:ADP-heptose:LPS heptosyltransferase
MTAWLDTRNLLAVRLDNIGDVVMLGPALRAIKATSPHARITLLATPGGATAAPLLPWVDDVLVWRPVWQDLGNLAFDPSRERQLIDVLAARAFDGALIFTSFSQTPHVAGYVCYLAGIPLRAGESKEFGGATLSTELRGAPDDMHQVERNLRLVEHLGFVPRQPRLSISIPTAARASAGELLRGIGISPEHPFVLLHPGASARARRYPVDRVGRVARSLHERGWPVLVTGTNREAEMVDAVVQAAPGATSLVGGTTLPEYAALIEAAALVICGNTLPMHLADALDTPVLILFSGTDLETQWSPRTAPSRLLRRPTPCHPCYRFDCPIGLPCLDIPPEEVVDQALALLRQGTALSSSPMPDLVAVAE